MPTQKTIRKIGINPFAVAASQGHKKGSKKYHEVVHAITRDALKQKKIGVCKTRKK